MNLFSEGVGDRKIAQMLSKPLTTITYRRKVLFKKLREELKDWSNQNK